MEQKNKTKSKKKINKKLKKDLPFLISLGIIIGIFLIIYFIPKLIPDKNEVITDEFYFNGFHFQKIGPLWYTQIQKNKEVFNLPMHYSPKELVNYKIDNETREELKDFFYKNISKIRDKDKFLYAYLTFNPYNNLTGLTLSVTELTFKLYQTSRIKLVGACTENKTGSNCENRLKITCNNTDFPVIFLDNNVPKYSNITDNYKDGLTIEDNCLIVKGNNTEILKWSDRILYNVFQIMN